MVPDPTVPDATALDAAARARLTDMYRTHHEAVERFVHRRAADIDANLVVTDVFIIAWQKLDQVPTERTLPWLYRTAHHVLHNRFRAQANDRRAVERLAAMPPLGGENDPSYATDRQELAEIFNGLRPEDREVLRLVAWEGLSVKEIAIVLNLKRTTVAMRLLRLRHRLNNPLHRPTRDGSDATVRAEQRLRDWLERRET